MSQEASSSKPASQDALEHTKPIQEARRPPPGEEIKGDVTTLDLRDRIFPPATLASLLEKLIHRDKLQNMKLDKSECNEESVKFVSQIAGGNLALTTLSLAQCKIGDHIRVLADGLKSNNSVTYLNLENNNLGTAIAHLARALETNITIKDLNLEYNNIKDEGARALREALLVNYALENLNLAYNDIGPDGADALATGLEMNSQLFKLNLYNNNIQTTGAKHLARALGVNSALTSINVHNNDIDLAEAATLHKLLRLNASYKEDIPKNPKEIAESLKVDLSSTTDPIAIKLNNIITCNSINDFNPWNWNGELPQGLPPTEFSANFWKAYKEVGARKSHMRRVPLHFKTSKEMEDHLRAQIEKEERWRHMKVIVLGNGRIGKTTFVHFLNNLVSPQTVKIKKEGEILKSTIGIEYAVMNMADTPVSVWDFAGQLEYTVTHQYFLSNKMVIYVICYDLSAEPREQHRQLNYWLCYLNSILCTSKPIPKTHASSKWKVFIVGTKADKKQPKSVDLDDIEKYRAQFPIIPIHHECYHISTIEGIQGIQGETLDSLCKAIPSECKRILDTHSNRIPCVVQDLDEFLKLSPKLILHQRDIEQCHKRWEKDGVMEYPLDYLQSIGNIVRFSEGRICIKPQLISQVLAKFIAPDDHIQEGQERRIFTEVEGRQGIFKLNEDALGRSAQDELDLLVYFGVCFKIPKPKDAVESYFMFPSFGFPRDIYNFKNYKDTMGYEGVKITAPNNNVFIPGLICQMIVQLCRKLNVYESDIFELGVNGIHLASPGVFDGQVIFYVLKDDPRHLFLLIMASNPSILRFVNVFQELIHDNFPQYLAYTKDNICSTCIKYIYATEQQTFKKMKFVTLDCKNCKQHEMEFQKPKPALVESCRTHSKFQHDIFINYRVATEGDTSVHPKSVVQLVYEHLSCERKDTGEPVFVFWDKECLNYGMNWEQGFLAGLLNASLIVLLISMKTLNGIKDKAAKSQDNVLLEYECALLRNKQAGTEVVPVFVGEETITGDKSTYARVGMGAAFSGYPSSPHKRGDDANKVIHYVGKGLRAEDKEFLGSVQKTIDSLSKMQGVHIIKRASDEGELKTLSAILMKILNKKKEPQQPIVEAELNEPSSPAITKA